MKLISVFAAAMIAATSATWAASDAPRARAASSAGWIAQLVLSDGTAPRNVPKIMSKPDEVRDAYAAAHVALPVELSINGFLIDTGTHRMQVDTGAGELFGATSGQLVANLRTSGYRPEDIDVILLTHIHGSHSKV